MKNILKFALLITFACLISNNYAADINTNLKQSTPHKYIFMTQNLIPSNFGSGSVQCQSDPANPLGIGHGNWQALVLENSATNPGQQYELITSSKNTVTITATGHHLLSYGSKIPQDLIPQNGTAVWFGSLNGNFGNCDFWNPAGKGAGGGVIDSSGKLWRSDNAYACGLGTASLYCVQQ